MRDLRKVVALMGALALMACGDNESTKIYEDSGTVDLPTVDMGQTTDTNQQGEGGVQDTGGIVEGGTTDTGGTVEGGTADTGGTTDTGGTVEGGTTDSGVIDAPAPDAPVTNPDAGTVDAPAPDAPVTTPDTGTVDAPVTTPDASTSDAPPDSVIGFNDAGQYVCNTLAGMLPCECNDGADNDGDKQIDYGNDPGCTSPWDNSEFDGSSQCTDTLDNDGDKLIDAADPGCTGPADNDESSYATGIPGDNKDPCRQDCFFDGNSGAGDDGCMWNLFCDPASPGSYNVKKCPYDPKKAQDLKKCPLTIPQACKDNCLTITPNGCDCFGCCWLTYGGVSKTVMLAPTCEPQYISDPTKCPPCTQVADCTNPCDLCEVCVGKPAPDPSCFSDAGVGDGGTGDGGSTSPCPPNEIYCGPGGIDPNNCPTGTYCITGCCKPDDILP